MERCEARIKVGDKQFRCDGEAGHHGAHYHNIVRVLTNIKIEWFDFHPL